jgi:hypothetical protein
MAAISVGHTIRHTEKASLGSIPPVARVSGAVSDQVWQLTRHISGAFADELHGYGLGIRPWL